MALFTRPLWCYSARHQHEEKHDDDVTPTHNHELSRRFIALSGAGEKRAGKEARLTSLSDELIYLRVSQINGCAFAGDAQ